MKVGKSGDEGGHGRRSQFRRRCDTRSVPPVPTADLRVLPVSASLTRGGRGRTPDDLPERVPWAPARDDDAFRAGLAVQDRAERLHRAPLVGGETAATRGARRSRSAAGGRACDRLRRRGHARADGPRRGPRLDAGPPAPGDSAARVAGALVSRDRSRAQPLARCRGDAHLPCPPHACVGARTAAGRRNATTAERRRSSPRRAHTEVRRPRAVAHAIRSR